MKFYLIALPEGLSRPGHISRTWYIEITYPISVFCCDTYILKRKLEMTECWNEHVNFHCVHRNINILWKIHTWTKCSRYNFGHLQSIHCHPLFFKLYLYYWSPTGSWFQKHRNKITELRRNLGIICSNLLVWFIRRQDQRRKTPDTNSGLGHLGSTFLYLTFVPWKRKDWKVIWKFTFSSKFISYHTRF